MEPAVDVASPSSASTATQPLTSTAEFTVTATSAGGPRPRPLHGDGSPRIHRRRIIGTLDYCAGGSTTLTAVPTGGIAPFGYQWYGRVTCLRVRLPRKRPTPPAPGAWRSPAVVQPWKLPSRWWRSPCYRIGLQQQPRVHRWHPGADGNGGIGTTYEWRNPANAVIGSPIVLNINNPAVSRAAPTPSAPPSTAAPAPRPPPR